MYIKFNCVYIEDSAMCIYIVGLYLQNVDIYWVGSAFLNFTTPTSDSSSVNKTIYRTSKTIHVKFRPDWYKFTKVKYSLVVILYLPL